MHQVKAPNLTKIVKPLTFNVYLNRSFPLHNPDYSTVHLYNAPCVVVNLEFSF